MSLSLVSDKKGGLDMFKKYAVLFLSVCCASAAEGRPSEYVYQLEGRHDPFQSFIANSGNVSPDVPVDTPQDRGGLSLEPGQLQLSAIISLPGVNGRKAMAEDVAGKGYFLDVGMPVGKYGTVRKIENGQVVIEESYRTASGRFVAKETVMRLKTEGEE
jgi:Tfp pilus assembly protein PilP